MLDISIYWALCKSCASCICGTRTPTPAYADATARLLFGTGAQESGYRNGRQLGFSLISTAGAFGFWQVEKGSVTDSLAYLARRCDVADRALPWLPEPHRRVAENSMDGRIVSELLKAIMWSPELGVFFSRVHYLRVPEPIPVRLEDQAGYWKRHYNTALGKGRPEQYINSWVRLCEDVV